MGNIVRFSPFQTERFSPFQEMERMLRDMDLRMHSIAGGASEPFTGIRLDVSEDDKAYTVKADLPGVSKDDIKVVIDGEHVSIAAEMKREVEEHGHNALYRERFSGRQTRSFSLDSVIDESHADAKYENGVLELTLPKKVGASTQRQLTVH
jgi:HSP20 family protein